MQSLTDIIQAIARQRGRGDTQPLILLRQLDAVPGERVSHLPIDGDLAQAWVALTGEPFRPHQAHALAALRRGESVALAAANAEIVMSAYLLLYATLRAQPAASALVLAPDRVAAQIIRSTLTRINQDLPRLFQLAPVMIDPQLRPDPYARVVIATPETLHGRLLRHHDRAWRLFWSRLRLLMLPDVHRYAGVAGAHLADLLLRLQRVAASHSGGHVPGTLATLYEIAEPEPALTSLLGPTRVIGGDDVPRSPATLAVWRAAARLRESVEIAAAMQRQGYNVHITCAPLDRAQLAPIVADIPGLTFGPDIPPVQVIVAAGFPGSHSALRRMLRSGCQAVILVLGDLPHEQALARQPESLLSDPATRWPEPAPNAYVTAQHVLCAATEQPLLDAEVDLWGAREIVERLVSHGQLVDLPDTEVAWKPTLAAGDPYAEFSLLSSSGGPIIARNEQSQVIGALDPTGFERWTFPNAALAPGVGGFRVLARDEETGSVSLRLESNGRRTYPLRRCEVTVRETRETRALAGGKPIGWGRVVVAEEIYGYREGTPAGAPADVALKPPLTARWTAPACWFDLPAGVQVLGQFIGWCLAAALPLRSLTSFTDAVPCYDHQTRRLYLVDAQPGGCGLAAWVYVHAEKLLPLAYDVALACRNDPLLEPLSRADMDWLLALLGRRAGEAIPLERPREAAPAQVGKPQHPQHAEAPPAPPRIILTPPPANDLYGRSPGPPRARDDEPPRRSEPPAQERSYPPPADRRTAGRRGVDSPPLRPDAEPPAEERARSQRSEPSQPPQPSPAERGAEPPPAKAGREQPPAPRRTARERQAQRRAARQTQQEFTEIEPPREQRSAQPPPTPASQAPPSRGPGPAATPPAAEAPPDDDGPPDPAALIARLRRQRQQREAAQQPARTPPGRREPAESAAVEARFAPGQRIFCLPYGDGVVRSSYVEEGRELLVVAFPDHGELTIDTAVSLVRKLEDARPDDDDLL